MILHVIVNDNLIWTALFHRNKNHWNCFQHSFLLSFSFCLITAEWWSVRQPQFPVELLYSSAATCICWLTSTLYYILFFLMCSIIFQKGPLAVAYISIYTVHSDFVFLLPLAMHVHTWPQMSCKKWEFLFWVKFDNFRGILMYHLHVKSLTPYVTVHH